MPTVMTTRREVIMRRGGSVITIHTGVMNKILMNRVVRAGLVVADVAVRCVERKSVNKRNGSRRTLHRVVKIVKVSTISSKLF